MTRCIKLLLKVRNGTGRQSHQGKVQSFLGERGEHSAGLLGQTFRPHPNPMGLHGCERAQTLIAKLTFWGKPGLST